MDHMMPGMDGLEATRLIREIGTEYARMVPIIAFTANALSGNDEMFLQNGFDGFIPKPIDIFRLDAALNKWVRKQDAALSAGSESPGGLGSSGGPEGSRFRKAGAAARDEVPASLLRDFHVDGLDIDGGLERYESTATYLEILKSYVRHTPELLGKIAAGYAQNPTEEEMQTYATFVHGLKGASYGICADAVGKRAETLELAAKAREWDMVRSGHDALLASAEALLGRLRELFEETSAQMPGKRLEKPARAEPDRATLEKMLSAARHFRTSQMEDLLAELDNFSYQSGAELVAWLREQTDNIEYDAIANRLELVLAKGE
jgi:HPt (histidine-containing phosphotransfer) domain-containing protein